MDAWGIFVLSLGCFILGAVLATILLLRVPKLYRFLLRKSKRLCCQVWRTRRNRTEKTERSEDVTDDLPYAMTDLGFRENAQQQNANKCTTVEGEKKGYQEFQSESRKNFHQYTPFQSNSKSGHQKAGRNEAYEYMHVDNDGKNDKDKDRQNADDNHQYFILEPHNKEPFGNIRRINEEEEIQYHNPNHIYFILEPNTSKLKQIDSSKETPERMPDHIYFVLEKETHDHYMSAEMNEQDTNRQDLINEIKKVHLGE